MSNANTVGFVNDAQFTPAIGDRVRVTYPEHGDGELAIYYGELETVGKTFVRLVTGTGNGYRSFSRSKIAGFMMKTEDGCGEGRYRDANIPEWKE